MKSQRKTLRIERNTSARKDHPTAQVTLLRPDSLMGWMQIQGAGANTSEAKLPAVIPGAEHKEIVGDAVRRGGDTRCLIGTLLACKLHHLVQEAGSKDTARWYRARAGVEKRIEPKRVDFSGMPRGRPELRSLRVAPMVRMASLIAKVAFGLVTSLAVVGMVLAYLFVHGGYCGANILDNSFEAIGIAKRFIVDRDGPFISAQVRNLRYEDPIDSGGRLQEIPGMWLFEIEIRRESANLAEPDVRTQVYAMAVTKCGEVLLKRN